MTLSLDEANRIAPGAIDKAEVLGIRISAAVYDGGGGTGQQDKDYAQVAAGGL